MWFCFFSSSVSRGFSSPLALGSAELLFGDDMANNSFGGMRQAVGQGRKMYMVVEDNLQAPPAWTKKDKFTNTTKREDQAI